MWVFIVTVWQYVKKTWPILYTKLLYKVGQDFLDIQYELYFSGKCGVLNIGMIIVATLYLATGIVREKLLCVQEVVTHFI